MKSQRDAVMTLSNAATIHGYVLDEKKELRRQVMENGSKIDGPFLIDLRLNDTHNHAEIGVKCGQ